MDKQPSLVNSSKPAVNWATSILGIIVAVILPVLGSFFFLSEEKSTPLILIGEIGFWLTCVIIGYLVLKREKKNWSFFGLSKFKGSSILMGLLVVIIGFVVSAVSYNIQIALGLSSNSEAATLIFSMPIWLKFLIVLRAGITEEFIYRGYLMGKLEEMSLHKFWVLMLPVILFTVVHLPGWGLGHLIIVLPLSLTFGLVFLWKRNLYINIIAHFLIDFIAVILVPLLTP